MSDRRQERRQQTIDGVVAAALDVMAGAGAAGLSLGEVAKRMRMRTPSLYGYFPSKAALCDEIFARGWREVGELMESSYDAFAEGDDAAALLLSSLTTFVGWALDHRPQAELMIWRPIPGWKPSPQAFAAAVGLVDAMHGALAALQRRGLLRADAEVEQMGRVMTVIAAGVISQQLSNEPGTPLAGGRLAGDLPRLVAMFVHEFGTADPLATRRSNGTRRKVSR
jgi:AcrR family transcriptional regulator